MPLQAAPLPVPTPEEHGAFLYGDWKADRPSAVMFLDPLCPYCKRAIPKLGTITQYNLFVFWSPIFGERSESIVGPLFQCARPGSKAVLDGIALDPRAAPTECPPHQDQGLRARNDAMVAAYGVNAVPAYFLQGRSTSLTQLQQTPAQGLPGRIQGVAMNWSRYGAGERIGTAAFESAAILLPPQTALDTAQRALSRFKPQYVFSADLWGSLCQQSPVRGCQQAQTMSRLYQEVVDLLGVQAKPQQPVVIGMDGVLSGF